MLSSLGGSNHGKFKHLNIKLSNINQSSGDSAFSALVTLVDEEEKSEMIM